MKKINWVSGQPRDVLHGHQLWWPSPAPDLVQGLGRAGWDKPISQGSLYGLVSLHVVSRACLLLNVFLHISIDGGLNTAASSRNRAVRHGWKSDYILRKVDRNLTNLDGNQINLDGIPTDHRKQQSFNFHILPILMHVFFLWFVK